MFVRWDKKWRKLTKAPGKPRPVTLKDSRIIKQKIVMDAQLEAFATLRKKTGALSETIIWRITKKKSGNF